MGSMWSRIKAWAIKNERHLSAIALATGFIIDSITLKRIDLPFENLILIGYFTVAGLSILILNYIGTRVHKTPLAIRLELWLPLVIQFAFGGLFSGFTIFYSRSGSLVASWPFILILLGLLVGNELMKRRYQQLVFQVTVFFTAIFFFTIFFIPVLLGRMGSIIFLLSGFVSLLVVSGFIYILFHVTRERAQESKRYIVISVVSVFIFINLLYFAKIIPPIPLSLKNAGVYQTLTQLGDEFHVRYEKPTFARIFQVCNTVHVVPGDPLYAYSSVFAPTRIQTDIVHHWQYFDKEENRWITSNRIPFSISGGRDMGYRGYSKKTALTEGCWRVDVETSRGQVIGRILFGVEFVSETPELEEKIL